MARLYFLLPDMGLIYPARGLIMAGAFVVQRETLRPDGVVSARFLPRKVTIPDFITPAPADEKLPGAVPEVVDLDDHRAFIGDGDVPASDLAVRERLLETDYF